MFQWLTYDQNMIFNAVYISQTQNVPNFENDPLKSPSDATINTNIN